MLYKHNPEGYKTRRRLLLDTLKIMVAAITVSIFFFGLCYATFSPIIPGSSFGINWAVGFTWDLAFISFTMGSLLLLVSSELSDTELGLAGEIDFKKGASGLLLAGTGFLIVNISYRLAQFPLLDKLLAEKGLFPAVFLGVPALVIGVIGLLSSVGISFTLLQLFYDISKLDYFGFHKDLEEDEPKENLKWYVRQLINPHKVSPENE